MTHHFYASNPTHGDRDRARIRSSAQEANTTALPRGLIVHWINCKSGYWYPCPCSFYSILPPCGSTVASHATTECPSSTCTHPAKREQLWATWSRSTVLPSTQHPGITRAVLTHAHSPSARNTYMAQLNTLAPLKEICYQLLPTFPM